MHLFDWLRFSSPTTRLTYASHSNRAARRLGNLATSFGISLAIGFGTLVYPLPAQAAEQLIVAYGPFNASLSVKDLEKLVATSEVSGPLKFYLGLANLDPNVLRSVLTMELDANSNFMSEMLDSDAGNHLLSQLSQVIYLSPTRPDIQVLKSANQDYVEASEAQNMEALKTALISSTADRHVTVLEVLQRYPAEKVCVDAIKLLNFANSLKTANSLPAH